MKHDGEALFFTVTAAKGEDERRSLPECVIRKRGIIEENSTMLAESGDSRGIINLTGPLDCGDEASVEAIRSRVDRWTDRRVKATVVSPELYGCHTDGVGPSIHPGTVGERLRLIARKRNVYVGLSIPFVIF